MHLSVWRNPVHFVACAFGVGLLPLMPGTYASLLGIVLTLLLSKLSITLNLIILIAMITAGIWLCGKTNQDFNTQDHPAVAYDELATFPIVMLFIPKTWLFFCLGFVLFRFFDIYKPSFIGWIDKNIHGGLGVMLDDVIAATSSWAILFTLTKILAITHIITQ